MEAVLLQSGSLSVGDGLSISSQVGVQDVFDDIRRDLADLLDAERYRHSVRTARVCRVLARRYGVDEERAYLAGLLHDCGKGRSLEILYGERARELERLDALTLETRALHHSFIGAHLSRTRFGVEDAEILDAICFHPTGSDDFGLLGRILYLADYLEPGRKFPDRKKLLDLAFDDLNGVLIEVIERRTTHLKSKGRAVHPRTEELWRVVQEEANPVECMIRNSTNG
ncbi:MAG TPA: bis(5'-nucleosyl)-tetraphosphatase (symmetrical) YqeK [bacterium]|nr:bis(5'-nucleosyl)-tetraphosphatase (symmetrical) YqeK [bacterium]